MTLSTRKPAIIRTFYTDPDPCWLRTNVKTLVEPWSKGRREVRVETQSISKLHENEAEPQHFCLHTVFETSHFSDKDHHAPTAQIAPITEGGLVSEVLHVWEGISPEFVDATPTRVFVSSEHETFEGPAIRRELIRTMTPLLFIHVGTYRQALQKARTETAQKNYDHSLQALLGRIEFWLSRVHYQGDMEASIDTWLLHA